MWILRAVEEFLHEVNGVVEVVIVHGAAVDVDLAAKFRSELFPIPLQDVAKIVILSPVISHVRVDLARPFVPDTFRISVGPDGAVDGLPDIPLVPGSRVRAEHELAEVDLFEGRPDLPETVSDSGARCALPGALREIGVPVVVDIDHGIGSKVDGVGAGGETAVELIRIENLHGQRFPATCGTAIGKASPSGADRAELLFHKGNQLVHDGITVGPEVL